MEEKVKDEIEISASQLSPADLSARGRVCLVCQRQFAKYTCPKCNTPYCSLVCYKGHSQTCTQQFQQDQFTQLLKGETVSEEDRRKMLQILQKEKELLQEDEDNNNPFLSDIDESLAELDLEDPNLFEKLSHHQQQDFLRAISDGRISRAIHIWLPWWTKGNKEKAKIIELNKEEKENIEEEYPIPNIYDKIPSLHSLIKTKPSHKLKFNLIEILYTYAFHSRLYNGDLHSEVIEVTSSIIQFSEVLCGNRVYDSLKEVVSHVVPKATQPNFGNSPALPVATLQDCATILSLKEHALRALSDLRIMFEETNGQLKGKSIIPVLKKLSKEAVLAEKKIIFFLSWINEIENVELIPLQVELEDEFKSQSKLLALRKKNKG